MSMTYSDILILLKAGYTKDEIDNMNDTTAEPQALAPFPEAGSSSLPPSADVPSESLQQESVPAPDVGDPEPAPQPAADPVGDQIKQLQEMMSGLIAQIQQGSREQAEMGAKIIDPHQSAIQTLRGLADIKSSQEE